MPWPPVHVIEPVCRPLGHLWQRTCPVQLPRHRALDEFLPAVGDELTHVEPLRAVLALHAPWRERAVQLILYPTRVRGRDHGERLHRAKVPGRESENALVRVPRGPGEPDLD